MQATSGRSRARRGAPGAVRVAADSSKPALLRACTRTLAGVKAKELACFQYDELSREFHFLGSNEEVKLVSDAKYQAGLAREVALSSLLV